MPKVNSFRVGKVSGYLRNHVWYLCYFDNGKRHRPRVGPDLSAARQFAAQVNGQLAAGAPAALSFEQVSVPTLRSRWLDHHEHVLRSSVKSIARYRTATDHLFRFLDTRPVRHAALFHTAHAEAFVRHLRVVKVSPNGHPNTATRPLLDKGVRFILECCRAMFNYAAKRRHLSPYADNPFAALDLDRIPVETSRPVTLLTLDQERAFLAACDDWQLPVFVTLLLTGLRPGELCHLLLPDDLDLAAGVVRVRNKPRLGWQVKTRNERDVPLVPELTSLLRVHVGDRTSGPVFLRRGWPAVGNTFSSALIAERELTRREAEREVVDGAPVSRADKLRLARRLWREMGAVREERVREEFIRGAKTAGLAGQTAPKVFRHQFATALQEGRVDPLVRNLLMGHSAAGERSAGHGLGMTAVYTHTRPETVREQLIAALAGRPASVAAGLWARRRYQSH